MITTIEDEAIPETVVVVQPNRSLSWQANLWIIAGVAACSVLLALIFIIRGQWVVLVFIALQCCGLSYALYKVKWALERREVITVTDTTIKVEFGIRYAVRTVEFPLVWVQLNWQQDDNPLDVGKLSLRYYGEVTTLGQSLGRDEKKLLYLKLRELLKSRLKF